MLEAKANTFVDSLGPVTVILYDFCLSFWKKSYKPGKNWIVHTQHVLQQFVSIIKK